MANEAEDVIARIYRLVRLGKEVREEKLKAARRCSDCHALRMAAHTDGYVRSKILMECLEGHFKKSVEWTDPVRETLRTAATCPDYEEAGDGE